MSPSIWYAFILNVLLQVFDGVLTYGVLHLGVSEANPLVNSAIAQWGTAWGLIYWKTLACVLLLLIFALRHKRQALTIRALTLTATVYGCFSIAGFFELLLQFNK
jgi:uncharacterized membrane protein